MNAVDFHGLRVGRYCQDVESGPLDRLFASFAPAPPGEARLTFALRPARGPANLRGFRQTFRHGVRGFERAGEILLLDGETQIRIASDGGTIEGEVAKGGDLETALLIALAIGLRHHGLFHMHAGALVQADGTGVLVLGGSGAGKSTVTRALLHSNSGFLGDDAVFLGERDGRLHVFALPRPFHLGEPTWAAFPGPVTAPHLASGKRAVTLEALPGRLRLAMEVPRLLLFPTVTDRPTTEITAISPADALGRALTASALAAVDGMPGVSAQLALLRRLIENARAYELRLGADMLAAPGHLATMIGPHLSRGISS